jgi:hypothetical protein
MDNFNRPDEGMAFAVDVAIKLDASSGYVPAWKHLQLHAVPRGVAIRVLSKDGPRRIAISHDKETPLDRRSNRHEITDVHGAQPNAAEPGNVLKFHVPRTNHALANIINQAIEMIGVHNRFYAEAFLRIHAVKSPVIMRVLFDANRRRKAAPQAARATPTRGIGVLHAV